MDRTLAVILSFFLLIVGGLAGGCSLLFAPEVLRGSGSDAGELVLWFAGLIIGGLAFWLAVRLIWKGIS